MTLKSFLVVAVVCSLALAQTPEKTSNGISAKARQIHESALIVDTHADTPQRFLDEGFDIGSTDPNDIGHISLDKARRGNLGAEFFSIWWIRRRIRATTANIVLISSILCTSRRRIIPTA